MGYACPVCDTPEVDGRHLANHVAFTALTGGDEHAAWLDEHVPEWGTLGEAALAEAVVPHAGETDALDAIEAGEEAPAVDRDPAAMPDLDEDAAEVLAEAREYTRRMEADDADETE